MIPLSDGMAPRRFPIVTVALIAANAAVWLFYELPNLNASIEHASFYPCTVDGSARSSPKDCSPAVGCETTPLPGASGHERRCAPRQRH